MEGKRGERGRRAFCGVLGLGIHVGCHLCGGLVVGQEGVYVLVAGGQAGRHHLHRRRQAVRRLAEQEAGAGTRGAPVKGSMLKRFVQVIKMRCDTGYRRKSSSSVKMLPLASGAHLGGQA